MMLKNKGFIFKVNADSSWMYSHSQVPSLVELDKCYRIYFATRNMKDDYGLVLSRGAYIDVDKKNMQRILSVSKSPVLDVGEPGAFDAHGSQPACFLEIDNSSYMYYTGWSRRVDVPYATSIGIAKSLDAGNYYEKIHLGPIMSITPDEPYLCNGPGSIIKKDNRLHMFYSSGVRWIERNIGYEPVYVIKKALSDDGIHWQRNAEPIIMPKMQYECQNSPSVIYFNDLFHMWFCYREALDFRNSDRGYRIGYAYSYDSNYWYRDDANSGIDISEQGWDSEMQCYPSAYILNNRVTILYCGNYFGRDGIGFVELGN